MQSQMRQRFCPQVSAATELEQSGGLDLIATNALVGALANADRLIEAERYLKRAVDITSERGMSWHNSRTTVNGNDDIYHISNPIQSHFLKWTLSACSLPGESDIKIRLPESLPRMMGL